LLRSERQEESHPWIARSHVGRDRRLESLSTNVRRLLGVEASEFLQDAERWEACINEEDLGKVQRAIDDAAQGKTVQLEYRVQHADGSYRWVLDTLSPGVSIGDATSVDGAWLDITERRRREEALREQVDALQRSNRELEEFAHIASHDLDEPLRAVTSYTQLIAERYGAEFDEEGRELLTFVVDGAQRMQDMVGDLLGYARMGQLDSDVGPVETRDAIRFAVAQLDLQIRETGAFLEVGALPTIWGGRSQIRTLFQNLIGNALKFRREDVAPAVSVSAEREGAMWRFHVDDNGIGIPTNQRERVFQVFQRGHPRSKYEGTGLGLAVCRRIVEHHEGRIGITALPENGTRVWFTLPQVVGADNGS